MTTTDDDDDRVNIGQSASGRWNGRVLQKEFDKPVGPLNIITASQPQSVDKHVYHVYLKELNQNGNWHR